MFMGQKVHPTGFRIGVNKTQSSVWFAKYGVFSNILKEDYEIRQSFSPLSKRAGIVKIEIKRKVNQLELLIYALHPRFLIHTDRPESRGRNLAEEISQFLKLQLRSLKNLDDSKQICIKVLRINKVENESLLVARSLGEQIERRVAFRKAVRQITTLLQKRRVRGFKIQVSGRLNGAEIARTEWVREGQVPLQTLRANISYAAYEAITIYGVLGIKVWIFISNLRVGYVNS